MAYVPTCREKEYYVACACDEIYAPPSAYFSLFGLTVQASFLTGEVTCLIMYVEPEPISVSTKRYFFPLENKFVSCVLWEQMNVFRFLLLYYMIFRL